jgi:hypothetical protein
MGRNKGVQRPLAVALSVFLLIASAAAQALASSTKPSTAAASNCDNVLFLGAAGSGESGYGPEVNSVRQELGATLAPYRTIQELPVPYRRDPYSNSSAARQALMTISRASRQASPGPSQNWRIRR